MERLSRMLDEAEPGPTLLHVQLSGFVCRLALVAGVVISRFLNFVGDASVVVGMMACKLNTCVR